MASLTVPLHFEFGPHGSPVVPGYIGVSAVAYSSSPGYGWQDPTVVDGMIRQTSPSLTSTFARSKDATFLVDVPNGTYDVTPTLGDSAYEHDNVSISAQGQLLASGLSTKAGQFLSPTYKVQVTDGQLALRFVDGSVDGTLRFALDTLDIVAAPAAQAGPSQAVNEGSPVAFTGSATGSSALSYQWNFGDGTSAAGSLTPTHVYADEGTYTATLTVTDALGVSSQAGTTITVNHVAPTPSLSGPSTGTAGASLAFSATATEPSAVDSAAGFTYTWSFGDGSAASGATPSHTYAGPGTYTVTVTATDQDGASSSTSSSVTVLSKTFVASQGLYAMGDVNRTAPQTVLSNPYVDGFAVRASWSFIEPAPGVYNWAYLDSVINAVTAAGKKVSLSIRAGVDTPSWVYAAGARSFSFVDSSGPAAQTMPIPWDPVFLTQWTNLIQQLGARYASNPALTQVKITGINYGTAETLLPISQGGTASNGTTTWNLTNDVANWQAAGYTRLKVESAWQTMADAWAKAFPNQQLAAILAPNNLPPIDSNGNIFSNLQGADNQLVTDLINLGMARYGSQFVVQNNGLSDTWIYSSITGVANQVTTGYQMLWFVTGDSSYRMNGGQAIAPATALQNAVNQALANHARYLELYPADITNPALQNVLASTHAGLVSNARPLGMITGLPASGSLVEGTNTFTLGTALADPNAAGASSFTYAWTVQHNGQTVATGAAPSITITATDSGNYTVSLTVTDAASQSSWANTQTISIANVAPTIGQLAVPLSMTQGISGTFSAAATDPGPADMAAGLTYTWRFGNGITATGSSVSYAYQWNGTYTVTLTVTDAGGSSTTTATTVTVAKPVHSAEGAAIALNAASFPAPTGVDLTGATYAWTVTKNGAVFATGSAANFTFTPNDLSNYVVTLAVTAKTGQSWTNTVGYIIDNVAPTITSVSVPATATKGSAVTFGATATDPGQADMTAGLTFTWLFGDTGTATGTSVSHTYAYKGTYTVTLIVTDPEGAKTISKNTIAVS
jgi:PKD repeat protein